MGGRRPGSGPDPGRVCRKTHRQVVSLVTDIPAGRPASCRGLGQARSRHAANLAGWAVPPSAALDPAANEPGRPIALDLAAALPHLHRRPPGDRVASIAGGLHPPAPPAPLLRPLSWRSARRPAPGRRPDRPGSRARCRPTGCQAPATPGDGWRRGRGGRHSSAVRPVRRSGSKRPQVAGVHQPLVTGRPGDHHGPKPGGSGDRGGARERLAALGGGIPGRVVAELA